MDSRRSGIEAPSPKRDPDSRYSFEVAAVSLWEEDCVDLMVLLERLRAAGIRDLRAHLDQHPELVREAVTLLRVTDVNEEAVRAFGAANKQELMDSLGRTFTDDSYEIFKEELVALSEGQRSITSEAQIRTLSGERKYFQITTVLPASGTRERAIVTLVDITERKRGEDALRESEERYRAFVATSSEGIWRYELDEPLDLSMPAEMQLEHLYRHAVLAEANDTMAQMYGFERAEQLAGAKLEATLPRDDPAAVAYLRQVIDSGFAFKELESSEKDQTGRVRHFSNSMMPILEDGKLVRGWGTQRDITQRKRADQALREADRRKDEFLATLAHELRNPLAPIRNAVHLLSTGPPPAQSTAALDMISRQVQHMVRLVDDLLEVSRITLGLVHLHHESLTLGQLIRDALDAVGPLIESAGHELEVHLPADPLRLEGGGTRLSQVFQNLLDNACKYTPRGGRIVLRAERLDHHAVVSVLDNGVGVSEETQPRVFELFTRIHPSDRIKVTGLGIGLALSKQLVELHGGRIELHSDGAGRGSEFRVYLPLAEEAQPQPATSTAESSSAADVERRVLVVDDNRDAAESLAMLLTLSGNLTETAYDGRQALEKLDGFQPEVVLLDIGMPGMDGYEVARRMRGTPRGADIRLIALTGWGQAEDRRRAEEAGFDLHVTKPVDPTTLQSLLR